MATAVAVKPELLEAHRVLAASGEQVFKVVALYSPGDMLAEFCSEGRPRTTILFVTRDKCLRTALLCDDNVIEVSEGWA